MVRDTRQFSKSMSPIRFTVILISTLVAVFYEFVSGLLQKKISREKYTMLEDFQ